MNRIQCQVGQEDSLKWNQGYMKEKLLQDFIKLVSSRTGLCVREADQGTFRIKLLKRIKFLNSSAQDYYGLLDNNSPEGRVEWSELASQLTTGESYFLRDKEQFSLLRNRILPELIERRGRERLLRIWSAGCASGEEPYSIAILLNELLPSREEWRILILGSDMNQHALDKAKKGLYTEWSFRQTLPDLRDRYFTGRKDSWEIDGNIRTMVTFSPCNLVSDPFPSRSNELHDMDLILCRNVFIYFDPETVARVTGKFADTLNEGGYLLTGHGELHPESMRRLRSRIWGNQVIYQKVSEPGLMDVVPVSKEVKRSFPKGGKTVRGAALSGKAADPVKSVYTGAVQKAKDAVIADTESLEARLLMARDFANRGEYDPCDPLLPGGGGDRDGLTPPIFYPCPDSRINRKK
jgi:chemotaxis protein methyltransferase CheR